MNKKLGKRWNFISKEKKTKNKRIVELVSKKATHVCSLIQAHMVKDGDLLLLTL